MATVHGPVIRQQGGEVIAMRVAALDKPFMLEQYRDLATAHNFPQFEKAVSRLEVPCFNIIYGDRDGHIEYLFNGTAPRRKSGDLRFWAGVVPGDTSDTLWNDYLSYKELPKSIDPPPAMCTTRTIRRGMRLGRTAPIQIITRRGSRRVR
jgi:acyl-homoserine-lactone acylase